MLESGDLGELEETQFQAIVIIGQRARALTKMVEDMGIILASENRQREWEAVDLLDLVSGLIKDYKLAVEEAGLELKKTFFADLPFIHGDPTHLRQVVENLFDNALKFTPARGEITVRLWSESNEVVLEVSDTGIGIPADQVERIFERFYQVDGSTTRHYGGTGLGLALVKEVVEAHGGQVEVESVVKEGSTFRVRLPVR
jgi:signal transduction histidine kinase